MLASIWLQGIGEESAQWMGAKTQQQFQF